MPNPTTTPPPPPLPLYPCQDPWPLAGCWAGGEHHLMVGGRRVAVNVWFHLFEGGEAILSLRAKDHRHPDRVHGRWWVEAHLLVVSFGGATIRAAFTQTEEVLHWAGETLLRLPDRTASIAFGIRLPYRFGQLGALQPERA